MERRSGKEWIAHITASGGIIVFFIMAFEIMIMISPFAFFFYSVFNPVFHWLDSYAATRWLTTFFLPHMILPPTLFLKTIRILGSVFFFVGASVFIISALQVYLGKIFGWGMANRGLYRYVRHPQYLALGIWGGGMAILWPRFIVLATLSVMIILYYFLAKDEERRMIARYGESYERYRQRTGMFFPLLVERYAHVKSRSRYVVFPVLTVFVVLGSGFILREVTLRSLPFESEDNIMLLSMLPEDNGLTGTVIHDVLKGRNEGGIGFLHAGNDYLGYLMPVDYIMQGMIANTGGEFHLYKRHHTFAMMTDWVLHPFEHLRRPPSALMAKMHHVDPVAARRSHCPLGINDSSMECESCPYRRVVFVRVEHTTPEERHSRTLPLSFALSRTPVGFVDINTRTGEIVDARKVGKATAWKDVPTPAL